MWRGVSLADAISPDANGATLDSQPLLSGPITQAADGGFTFPIIGGAVQVDPALGAIFAFTPKDNDGKIVTDAPMAFGMRVTIDTSPAGSSGYVLVAGLGSDAALTNSTWAAMDWDGADPRARAGLTNTPNVSGTRTGIGSFVLSAMIRPGGAAAECTIAQVSSSLVTLATGAYNTQALKTTNLDLTAIPVAFFGVFGSGVLGADSPKISVEYFYTALPAGTRL